ncbi:MAG: 23S rRNA (uracil(1939)-C(5))-methyltransferase RlmD [bacterium]
MTIDITQLTQGGDGLGWLNNQAIFVPFTAPGDYISADIVKKEKDFIKASLNEIIKPSPSRISPQCPYFGECGGCQWQHLHYQEQLSQKMVIVQEAFERIAKLRDIPVKPIIPSPEHVHYRHRMQFSINHINKKAHIGLYTQKTHELVAIRECLIAHPLINKILKDSWRWMESYDDKHLMGIDITSDKEGEKALLVIRYLKGDIKEKKENIAHLTSLCPEIAGVLLRIQKYKASRTEYIGEHYLSLHIHKYTYLIAPESFIQVNLKGNEILIQQVLDAATPFSPQNIVELHCGMGNFSIPLSTITQKLLGIESDTDAYKCALANAYQNKRGNCSFLKKSDIKGLRELIRQDKHFSLLILDPPRCGCKQILDFIPQLDIQKIVFVSCNPATLARDIAHLHNLGYELESVQPIDMFPQTFHVETVCVLTKR